VAYYYFIAQLPYLVYEQKPPMSSVSFKELARPLMSKSDLDLLNMLSLSPPSENASSSGCDFIDKWNDWEQVFRLSLAKQRIHKLKRDTHLPEPSTVHTDAAAAASKAVDENSPLEGENVVNKARWNAIDGFVGSDYFGRNNVYAYFLKLLLQERRVAFNAEKGFAEYKSLYASILESSQESRGEHT
jgi:hypothetical protein